MKNKLQKILIVHTSHISFVKKDIQILKERKPIQLFFYKPSKKLLPNLINQIKLLLVILANIRQTWLFYIWFADYHSFLPILFARIFRKKSILILGGYDVTYIPEIKYGSFSNPIRSFCSRFSIQNASILLPVDESLINDAKKYVSHFRGKIIPLPTGYSPQFWKRTSSKEKIVLTVAICHTFQRFRLKGIDLFIKVAKITPEYRFIIIGMHKKILDQISPLPQNVQVYDKLSPSELQKFYSKAKVYVQISMREGLPNTLCEAMLCECIPVGTNVGAIPKVIDDCGFIVGSRKPSEIKAAILRAMNSPEKLGKNARNRIATLFPETIRKNRLYSILEE